MTVTSAAGVEFARALGCQLVVLARECSIKEIAEIRTILDARQTSLPLEVFVHGALCVAYSGQCLTSESLGGRSANRGECAQACRMPYELVADNETVPLGDRRYLLSPQDLSGLDAIADLAQAGVTSLKIEGRLKSPEYVASITRVYRAALDRLRPTCCPRARIPATERYELEMGFLARTLHRLAARNRQPAARPRAVRQKTRRVSGDGPARARRAGVPRPMPQAALKARRRRGFRRRPARPARGGRAGVRGGPRRARRHRAHVRTTASVDFARVRPGDRLWKTERPGAGPPPKADVRRGHLPRFQRPVDFEVHGHAGAPLTLMVRDGQGHVVQVDSAVPLTVAEQQPLTTERLTEQLGRLGGSPFRLGERSAIAWKAESSCR